MPTTIHRQLIALLIMLLFSSVVCVAEGSESATTMKAKADALYNADRYVEAFDQYTLAMKRADKEGNELMREECLGNIGNIFGFFGDYERANAYFEKALKGAIQNHHNDVAAKCVINMVVTYVQMGHPDRAKEYFAMQNRIGLSNPALRQFFFYQSQAYIAFGEKHYALCVAMNRQAEIVARRKKLPQSYLASLNSLTGNCYQAEGKLDSAIVAYQRNVEPCRRLGNRMYLAEAYRNLAEAYRMLGERQNMLEYQSLYMAQTDTIFGEKQFNMAKDKLFKYENDQTNALITSLNTRVSNAYTGIFVIALFLIAVGALAYVIHRKNRRLNSAYLMLYTKNQELMSSHEESQQLRKQLAVPEEANVRDAQAESREQGFSGNTTRMLNDINTVMENIAIISNPDFSITALAEAVGSHTKTVSSVINSTYGKNFKTLLNEYRIREACRRLADDKTYGKLTIKAIAESVGYNSINNFIIAFKRIVGITPSAYQRMAKRGDEKRAKVV